MSNAPVIPKNYLQNLRNLGVIAHIDAGKTTLTERILFYTHRIHRMGEVHEGAATMDYMPEEQERGITINSACTTCQWRDKTLNIIDTPGHVDFTIEVERSLRVLDGAVGVFCGVGGVEPQSETVWRQSEKFHVPKLGFVNKMDRPGADFGAVLDAMRQRLKAKPLPLQIPLGAGAELEGVVDLVAMEKLIFDQGGLGEKYLRLSLDAAEQEAAAQWRELMLETLAEEDEEFMEVYLSGEEAGPDLLKAAVRRATLGLKLTPVFAGSALKNIGVQPLLDGVCDFLPSPAEVSQVEAIDVKTRAKLALVSKHTEPFAALVFKITMETGRKLALMRIYSGKLQSGQKVYNAAQEKDEKPARLFKMHAASKERTDMALAGEIVAAAGMKFARTGDTLCDPESPVILERIADYKPVISLALEPANSAEGDKLAEVMEKFLLEDPTLAWEADQETGQYVISGMGELHLEVILHRLQREYSLTLRSGNPQVVFQETVSAKASGEAEFHRELGEVMHHGFVAVEVAPRERDTGNVVRLGMDTEGWSQSMVDAALEGVQSGLQSGVLKGYPVQDVLVTVTEMRRKNSESSGPGYHMAGVAAVKNALQAAGPVLLEPIMWVEISLPEEFVGEAVSLLGAKGAKVENMLDRAGQKVVQALAPMRQLFGFSTTLRSATQGRAGLMLKFSRFDMLS